MVRAMAKYWTWVLVLSFALLASGCGPDRVPQYEPKPGDKKMTEEEAQAAKADAAAKTATDREAAFKRYGIDPNSKPAMPTIPAKK